MLLVEIRDVSAEVGGQELFHSASGQVRSGQRIALVGPNGAGKSTLMDIVAGARPAASGEISLGGGVRLGYLRQQQASAPGETLYGHALGAGNGEVVRLERKLRELERRMAGEPELVDAYGRALQQYERLDGYNFEARVRQHLLGVGFLPEDDETPVDRLSGGQRVRLALARLMLEEPDLLLLDEPTNHLDLPALAWLEETLQAFRGGILFVSHDRAFLERVATGVWAFSPLGFETYPGGYAQWRDSLARRTEELRRHDLQRQAERERLEAYIRRYKAGNRSRQAHDRERKLQRIAGAQTVRAERRMRLRFTAEPAGERELFLRVRDLTARLGERTLWQNLSFNLEEGGRLGLVGRNGGGKTTLLRILSGDLQPTRGEIVWAPGARLGWLRQEVFVVGETPLDALLRLTHMTNFEARRLLAHHLFTDEQVLTPVEGLSGGERTRLGLAVLVAQGANVLLLDEPTNHLDVGAQESIEEALQGFRGTLILASHDRALLRSVTERWLLVGSAEGEGRVVGDWDDVVAAQERLRLRVPTKRPPQGRPTRRPGTESDRRMRALLRQEIARLEREIAAWEGERETLEGTFSEGYAAGLPERLARYEEIGGSLQRAYAEWARLAEELEAAQGE